ncbi:MAG: phosphoribosylaminoimidazole carboxylase (NCAIR synthetase) [Myxococcota bacterium]|jgi:phosphoribosylaminoimidazole carboxylase (NCAIR synthetase)
MHTIFVAPHFPAGQRRFAQGLKNVGARITGIIDCPIDFVDSAVRALMDDYERVSSLADEDAMVAAVQRIQARSPGVDRLEATIESHTLMTARVRERCEIPGLSYAVVERCRDKLLMKQFLAKHGIPGARAAQVSTAKDAWDFANQVGFPLILKPRDGAGAYATYKLENAEQLSMALAQTGLDKRVGYFIIEQFVSGHEGFYDTLTVGGKVVFEFVSHYYPNVLTAMRDRSVSPVIIATNRVEQGGYMELRHFGRKVVTALGIDTAATHMEWFFGEKGLLFAEIGARPPGVNYWDVYSAIGEVDIYTEWARAVCWGDVHATPSRQYSGGIVSIRPDRDGHIRGYAGADEVQRRFGEYIFKARLPPEGTATQPIEAGYLANAYVCVKHEDYDTCRDILQEIGRTLKLYAA